MNERLQHVMYLRREIDYNIIIALTTATANNGDSSNIFFLHVVVTNY